ncbi:MAG: hypothetical protein AAF125_25830, partial [Chloroflexota bacterium]
QHLPVWQADGQQVDEALVRRVVATGEADPLTQHGVATENLISFEPETDTPSEVLALLPPVFWYFGVEDGFGEEIRVELDQTYGFVWHPTVDYDEWFEAQHSERQLYQLVPAYYGSPLPDEQRARVQFEDTVALHQWALRSSVDVQPCETVVVDSWWQALNDVTADYSMTLVMLDDGNVPITQDDRALGVVMGTQNWQPDDTLYWDQRALTVPCDTEPGQYAIIKSVYFYLESEQGLEARLEDGSTLGNWAYLTTLNVNPPTG